MVSAKWSDWAYLLASIMAYYIMSSRGNDETYTINALWAFVRMCRWMRRNIQRMENTAYAYIDRLLEEDRMV